MSRKTVRHYLAQYFANPSIAGIGTVYPAPPKISGSPEMWVDAPDGQASGSLLYVEIMHHKVTREALGGAGAGDRLFAYDVRLHLKFRSMQMESEDAMDDHDDIIAAIEARILADNQAGTSLLTNPIFQIGETQAGFDVHVGMPKDSAQGVTHIWSVIDTQCWEWLTGSYGQAH